MIASGMRANATLSTDVRCGLIPETILLGRDLSPGMGGRKTVNATPSDARSLRTLLKSAPITFYFSGQPTWLSSQARADSVFPQPA